MLQLHLYDLANHIATLLNGKEFVTSAVLEDGDQFTVAGKIFQVNYG